MSVGGRMNNHIEYIQEPSSMANEQVVMSAEVIFQFEGHFRQDGYERD